MWVVENEKKEKDKAASVGWWFAGKLLSKRGLLAHGIDFGCFVEIVGSCGLG